MPKTKVVVLSTLRVNHALFHHNDGTWTVRAVIMGNRDFYLTPFDAGITGNHRTAQAALNAYGKKSKKVFPGWFIK